MQRFLCDGCGKEMKRNDTRYKVKIDVRVAKGDFEFSLLDMLRDHKKELEDLVKKFEDKDPKKNETTIYKGYKLDLYHKCQSTYIRDPLRFHPEQGLPETGIDIDEFLRTLDNMPGDGHKSEE